MAYLSLISKLRGLSPDRVEGRQKNDLQRLRRIRESVGTMLPTQQWPDLTTTQSHLVELERALQLVRAWQIQRRLLAQPRRLNGFRVAAEYVPAKTLGGDFFELFSPTAGKITAVIGDVSGNGLAAARRMSFVNAELRQAIQDGSPSELLSALNARLADDLPDDSFVTAVCVELDIHEQTIRVANAGHIFPLVRSEEGRVDVIGRASGPALGMVRDYSYPEQRFGLNGGDIVLLMTDGVAEAMEADLLSMGNVVRLVKEGRHDPKTLCRSLRLKASLNKHDDRTLLALQPVSSTMTLSRAFQKVAEQATLPAFGWAESG